MKCPYRIIKTTDETHLSFKEERISFDDCYEFDCPCYSISKYLGKEYEHCAKVRSNDVQVNMDWGDKK